MNTTNIEGNMTWYVKAIGLGTNLVGNGRVVGIDFCSWFVS